MEKKEFEVDHFSKYQLDDGTNILHVWKQRDDEITYEKKLRKRDDGLYEEFN